MSDNKKFDVTITVQEIKSGESYAGGIAFDNLSLLYNIHFALHLNMIGETQGKESIARMRSVTSMQLWKEARDKLRKVWRADRSDNPDMPDLIGELFLALLIESAICFYKTPPQQLAQGNLGLLIGGIVGKSMDVPTMAPMNWLTRTAKLDRNPMLVQFLEQFA